MHHEITVSGIVLAAGRATRMGRPKALLPFRGETLLARAARTMREGGCRTVVLVIDPDVEALAAEAAAIEGAEVVAGRPDATPLDSLRAGLARVPREHGLLVLPVDAAVVDTATIAAVIGALARSSADIVIAAHGDEPGHPVALDAGLRERLESAPLADGIRTLYEDPELRCIRLETGNPAVLADIDTPDDALAWLDAQ